jgi:hypothetical protein
MELIAYSLYTPSWGGQEQPKLCFFKIRFNAPPVLFITRTVRNVLTLRLPN